VEQVKLLSMTVVLTVLVWASADSLVTETVTVGVSFDVLPERSRPLMLVTLDTESNSFELQVSGPRSLVSALQAQPLLRLRLRVKDSDTGPVNVSLEPEMLREALAGVSREFRKLAVVSIQPDSLPVKIDHMVTHDVEVVARKLSLPYEVEPQLETTRVSVTLRETEYVKLTENQPLQIAIGPDIERQLKDKPPGKAVQIAVPLDAQKLGPGARIDPPIINVSATVQAQRVTAQIPTVPILLAMSFANLERPLRPVTRDGTALSLVTQTITVSGLRSDVARLQRRETRAYGVIQLKQEDLESLGVLKLVTPDYLLPDGITLAIEPSPIEFKLIRASVNGN